MTIPKQTLLLASVMLLAVLSGCTTWLSPSYIRAGQMQIISALTQSGETAMATQSFSSSLPNVINAQTSSGVSLMSFDCWPTDQFSYNITITQLLQSSITVNFAVLGDTYFEMGRINYIVSQATPIGVDYIIAVLSGCYLTVDLWGLDTTARNVPRNQTVGGLTFPITPSSVDSVTVLTMISGMKLVNQLGPTYDLSVKTLWTPGNINVNYFVQVGGNDYLQAICLTTVYNDFVFNANKFVLVIETMQMLINQTYNLTHVKYQQRYDGLDRMFFGFSSFNFTMSGDHYLNVDNYNISFVASLYNTNSMLNYMQYNMLFMARRVCSSSLTYYDQLTYACVSSCPTSSFINSGYSLCVLCSFKCQSCTVNLPDSCLQCNATCNRQGPTSNTCTCKSGFVENNEAICPTCDTFLPGCTNCISKTVCTACKSPYTLDNSTSTCVCKPTYYLVNNVYCLKFPGCTQASFMTTGVQCLECDNSLFFSLNADNICKCFRGYTPVVDKCIPNCGNGEIPAGYCFDNNAAIDDGCTPACKIQDGWHCASTNSSNLLSTCKPILKLNITYLYTEKVLGKNAANIVFALTPPQNTLNFSAFKSSSNLACCMGTDSVQPSFDPVNSNIIITVGYSSPIEGANMSISVYFDNLPIYGLPITMYFTTKGANLALLVQQYGEISSVLIYVSMVLGALSVVIAIFSAVVGLKMVGIQLILPIQLIYFSLSTMNYQSQYIFALSYLKYSNGYSNIIPYDYLDTYQQSPNLIAILYETQFLLSVNVMMFLLMLIIIFLFFHNLILKYKEHKLNTFMVIHNKKDQDKDNTNNHDSIEQKQTLKANQQQQAPLQEQDVDVNNAECKLRGDIYTSFKFLTFQVDRVFFIFFVLLINQVVFGFLVMQSNSPIGTFNLPEDLNDFCCMSFLFLMVMCSSFLSYDKDNSKLVVFTCLHDLYPYLYLLWDTLIIVIIGSIYDYQWTQYLLIPLSAGLLIMVIYFRPYSYKFLQLENLIAIFCQFIYFASMVILSILANISSKQISFVICAIIISALVAVAQILTIIRVAVKVNFKKAFDDLKTVDFQITDKDRKAKMKVVEKNLDLLAPDVTLQGTVPDSIRNGLLSPADRFENWQSRNTEEFQTERKFRKDFQQDDDVMVDVKIDQKKDQLENVKERLRNNLKMKKREKESELLAKIKGQQNTDGL